MEPQLIAANSPLFIAMAVLSLVGLCTLVLLVGIVTIYRRRPVTVQVAVRDDMNMQIRIATYHGEALVHWAEYDETPAVVFVKLTGRGSLPPSC